MQPNNPMNQIEEGFCFSVRSSTGGGTDKKDPCKVFINVCGHPLIGLPQHKNGTEIEESFLDRQGIDNLGVPIDVAPVHRETIEGKEDRGECSFVDVLVNPAISRRCSDPNHHMSKVLTARMITLACHWVKQENPQDLKGLEGLTAKLLTNVKRKTGSKKKHMESINKKAEAMYQEMVDQQQKKDEKLHEEAAAMNIPDQFNLLKKQDGFAHGGSGGEPPSSQQQREDGDKKKKGPMVVEVDDQGKELKFSTQQSQEGEGASTTQPATTAVKKGFFNDTKTPLYGDEGTKEGVLPDGAGDPLGYLPKSLRSKVKAIDCRGEQGEQFMKYSAEALEKKAEPSTTSRADNSWQSSNKSVADAFKTPQQHQTKAASSTTGGSALDVDDDDFRPTPAQPQGSSGITFSTQKSSSGANAATAAAKIVEQKISNGIVIEAAPGPVPARESWPFTVVPNDDAATVIVSIEVPETITSMSQLDLSVDSFGLDLKEEGGGAWTRVPLSDFTAGGKKIDEDSPQAKFLKKSQKLKVTLSLKDADP